MNMDDYKVVGEIVHCASGDGNIAAEYAVHPTKGWRVPLCERCAEVMRKLQEVFGKDIKN
jgi:hypothetical protein